jgi:hypothetical protein
MCPPRLTSLIDLPRDASAQLGERMYHRSRGIRDIRCTTQRDDVPVATWYAPYIENIGLGRDENFHLCTVRSVPIFYHKLGNSVRETTVLAQVHKNPQKGQLKLKTRRLLYLKLIPGDCVY